MAGAAVLSLLGSALSGFIFNYYNLLINKHVKFPFFFFNFDLFYFFCCDGRQGVAVGCAVVAGGFAVVNAFASGAVVAVATACVALIAIKLLVRCLC